MTLAAMQARFAVPGRVEAILLRPGRREATVAVEAADLLTSGLRGDRARAGKRAVTLIQAEHLPVVVALAGLQEVDPALLRRNLLISGLNIGAFRGGRLRVGDAVIELTVPAHPCSRMEEVLGPGGYTAMRGHGGMCAQVIVPGSVKVADVVVPA
ncbi:MAG: MOSC domain-containing protein [Silicimonas sp.]|nr:MOSC domain-containing protein [Silicimonas sp.]